MTRDILKLGLMKRLCLLKTKPILILFKHLSMIVIFTLPQNLSIRLIFLPIAGKMVLMVFLLLISLYRIQELKNHGINTIMKSTIILFLLVLTAMKLAMNSQLVLIGAGKDLLLETSQ
jgi:hypothetical protein